MDVLITVLMKTPIYMGSLIMKEKKEKNDLLSSLFVLLVSLFLSSFFITCYLHESSDRQTHKTSKKMTNITKLGFAALDISGKNYLSWILDVEIHLDAMNLGNTIKEGNTTSQQDHAKALIFLLHHIDEGLKSEYLMVKDLLILWKSLKEWYDHQKTVILPRARYDWIHLRLQDFKSISDYNSTLFKISS